MDIRKLVKTQMKQKALEPRDVAALCQVAKVRGLGWRNIDNFVNYGKSLNTEALGVVLDVLGITVGAANVSTLRKNYEHKLKAVENREKAVKAEEKRMRAVRMTVWHHASAVSRRARRSWLGFLDVYGQIRDGKTIGV